MLAASEVAECSDPTPMEVRALLEIRADGGAQALPIARLIIGVSDIDRPSRKLQRQNVTWLLRRLLSLTYPESCRAWTLAHRSSGAPYLTRLAGQETLPGVSLSHAGAWAVAVISTAAGVGIDVEQAKTGRDTARLANFMGWKPVGATDGDFYCRWSLWEAYTKCRGGHLFAPAGAEFEEICAKPDLGREREARVWHGLGLRVADDVVAAVVLRTAKPTVIRVRELDKSRIRPW